MTSNAKKNTKIAQFSLHNLIDYFSILFGIR